LFTDNKIYIFKDGKVDTNRPFVHPLMILGFDIYRLSSADALEKLKGLKFDLSVLREDTCKAGRPMSWAPGKAICIRRNSGSTRKICILCG